MSGETNAEAERHPDDAPGDGARETGPALEAHYRFIVWLVPTLERFPRSQKFFLGDRIQSVALDVLEALIEATYTRQRRDHLARANLGIEQLRFLCRLAGDVATPGKAALRVRSTLSGRDWPQDRSMDQGASYARETCKPVPACP